ncbi:MAG: polysaccharide deacetylase family protein [Clostridia bacterium]|nr:polysaccharide deacetylase family protein [Clostridia bacterium]
MKISIFALMLALLFGASACAQEEALPQKVVYLTFDDGPRQDTPELLALLEELDVPATFFFWGLSVKQYPQEAKLVIDAGHAVGCHSMSHKASLIKEDHSVVRREIKRFHAMMRELVDETFTTDLFRFPGGSGSYPLSVRRAVVEEGLAWFDWNGSTGDSHTGMKARDLYDYAMKTSADADVIIMLMHEGKAGTRYILPELVTYFRERGYVFRVLATDETERAILARCPVKMMLPEETGGREQ